MVRNIQLGALGVALLSTFVGFATLAVLGIVTAGALVFLNKD
jgi:hypothetical protein